MKRSVLILATAAFLTIGLAACSGNKSENSNEAVPTEEVVEEVVVAEAPAALDIDGLKALTKKKSKELTSADYDFLLDQCDIIAAKVSGMSKEEASKNLSEDEMGALIVIAMGLDSAKKKGLLTDAQLKRYEEMQAKGPMQ